MKPDSLVARVVGARYYYGSSIRSAALGSNPNIWET